LKVENAILFEIENSLLLASSAVGTLLLPLDFHVRFTPFQSKHLHHIRASIYIIRPMNSAKAPPTVKVTDGYRLAAPFVDVDAELLVWDAELDPVLEELAETVLSTPPSMVTPGRLAEALAARAV